MSRCGATFDENVMCAEFPPGREAVKNCLERPSVRGRPAPPGWNARSARVFQGRIRID